jgi:hypothetical protein
MLVVGQQRLEGQAQSAGAIRGRFKHGSSLYAIYNKSIKKARCFLEKMTWWQNFFLNGKSEPGQTSARERLHTAKVNNYGLRPTPAEGGGVNPLVGLIYCLNRSVGNLRFRHYLRFRRRVADWEGGKPGKTEKGKSALSLGVRLGEDGYVRAWVGAARGTWRVRQGKSPLCRHGEWRRKSRLVDVV